MHSSLRRRVIAVLILAGFLVIGFTARTWAAPAGEEPAMYAPPGTDTATPSDTPTDTPTETPTDTSTPTPTPPLLVISQIYAGGGSLGAPYQYDYIELFNRGDVPVDLSGMSVQFLSTDPSATFVPVTTSLPGSLPPGQYYLINLGLPAPAGTGTPTNTPTDTPATPTYTPMPSPDAQGEATIPADAGTIALVNSTLSLGCNNGTVSCDLVLPLIIDRVGYGAGSFPEGSAAPSPGALDADFRAMGGCTDTNDNASDFATATPGPRNLSSTPNYCVVTATPTNTPTDTGTPTNTATATNTSTSTNTNTPTSTGFPTRSVVINEIAWAGTRASTEDEWIELYNTTGYPITLTGWKLVASHGSPSVVDFSIDLTGVIDPLSFYLLERCDDYTVSNIQADLIYSCSATLTNNGGTLKLIDPNGKTVIDTANADGGPWPAGLASPYYNTMERRAGMADSDTAWITNTGVLKNGLDAGIPSGCTTNVNCTTNPQAIYGTPRSVNWAAFVTPTPSPTPSRSPTPTRTYVSYQTPVSSHPFVVLNEFLPKPGSDWNQDGTANTDDEFIEIINIGSTQVNLFGWKLDDGDPATPAYAIPGQILSPGQRLAFFALETGLTLPDGGGTVRLYSQSVVVDAYTYPSVTQTDISWCRIPDGSGGWVFGCEPSPDEPNQASGGAGGTPFPTQVPTGEPAGGGTPPPPVSSLCLYQEENYPPAVYSAECYVPGLGIWSPAYWDASTVKFGALPYDPYYSKWMAYIE